MFAYPEPAYLIADLSQLDNQVDETWFIIVFTIGDIISLLSGKYFSLSREFRLSK